MSEIQILTACRVAAQWHAAQRRRGVKQEPYINHLIEVAELVATADPGNTGLAIAALLHDAVEDQNQSRDSIAVLFGEHVADLVIEVTEDKSIERHVREQLQIEEAPKKSRGAKLLRLADKVSNLRYFAVSPPLDWDARRRRDYIEWTDKVATGVRGISPWLDQQFDDAKAVALGCFEPDQ